MTQIADTTSFFTTARRRLNDEIRKLSLREKLLCFAAFIAVASFVVSWSVENVRQRFEVQSLEIESSQRAVQEVAKGLVLYAQLSEKKRAIEERYKQIEIAEGVRSHIEELLKTRGGITSGYTIREQPTTSFGGNYELAPYSIRFSSTSVSNVITFLGELVHGPKPLILTDLEIKRTRIGDRLDININVNTIRRIAEASTPG
jgi:hypothetical protein